MRKYFTAFILIILCPNIISASSDTSLFLIPQPKKVELRNNVFSFNHSFSISAINTDTFYAQQLQNAIGKKFKTKPVEFTSAKFHIMLIKTDSSQLSSYLKPEKLALPFALGDEGYVISISPETIFIVATDNAGVFYGVQTLIQLINANSINNTIPCMAIYDKPDMAMRGWQDDISRGPIPTMDFLKEEIRRMASFKLNTFTLYTEHVFKLRKHPGIAPPDGITADEVRELVRFAHQYNVDIIGNFQSFGHFENILKVPEYKYLGENQSTISPAKEESYKFLSDVYSEIVPAYDSKYFHINCDEVGLGDGPSKKLIDSIGIDGVYAYHINRINDLLKPYHKQIMMWGDIAVNNPKIIDRLPKDMIIVSWGYSAIDSRDDQILPFVKSGFQFIVAPGVSCWGRIYPDMNRANINIYNYLRDGYKYKAIGFINTTWDDDGQNLFNNNWYGLVWGADCGWNAPTVESVKESEVTRKNRLASFNRCYNRVYFGTDSDIASLLLGVAGLNYGPVRNSLSDEGIWNPLLPDNTVIPENYERDNHNLIKSIDSLLTEANKLRPYFGNRLSEYDLLPFALRQARLVANRNLLGIKLKDYIRNGTPVDISHFEADFKALDDTVHQLKSAYGQLWKLENRNWWLDTVYSYYNTFASNLNDLKGVCIIKASDKLVDGKREITLRSAFNSLPVYYTADGSIPTLNSTKYTQPVYVDTNVNIRARVIDNGRLYAVVSDSLIYHKGIGKLYRLNSKWSTERAAYAAGGELGLLDGRRGSRNDFSDGAWQAYFGSDINIELDMGAVTDINKITMGFGQLMRYGILFPKQIEVSTSPDGINYTLVKTVENTLDPKTEERQTHDYVIALNGIRSRYVKIIARSTGPLPDWHYAKGHTSWLFADEIIVE